MEGGREEERSGEMMEGGREEERRGRESRNNSKVCTSIELFVCGCVSLPGNASIPTPYT